MTFIVKPRLRTSARLLVVATLSGIAAASCSSNNETCATKGTCGVSAGSAGAPTASGAGESSTNPTNQAGGSVAIGDFGGVAGATAGVAGYFGTNQGGRAGNATEAGGISGAGTAGTAGRLAAAGTAGQQSTEQALVVSIPDMKVRIVPGQTATVTLSLKRMGDVSGVVRVTFQGLPTGVSATDFDIPDGVESAQFQIKTVTNLQIGGPFSFSITAKSIVLPSVSVAVAANLYLVSTPGTLDVTFGSQGMTTLQVIAPNSTTTGYGEDQWDIVVDDQSRISICGYTYRDDVGNNGWIVRLASNGLLDQQFGRKGKLDFGGPSTYVNRLALNGQGLYLSAGETSSDPTPVVTKYVRKLDQSGLTDASFNSGQNFVTPDPIDELEAFKSGIVLVSGGIPKALAADGTVDKSFVAPAGLAINRVAADGNGRLLYGGFGNSGFVFGRLLDSGAVDSGFGTNGISTVPFRVNDDYAKIVALLPLPNGSLAAVVASENGQDVENGETSIQAFSSTGTPLQSYGQGGKVIVRSPGWAVGAVAQADGKITVVYVVYTKQSSGFTAVSSVGMKRYLPDGTSDATLGQNGEVLITQIVPQSGVGSVAYDSKAERIVIDGHLPTNSKQLGILRYWL